MYLKIQSINQQEESWAFGTAISLLYMLRRLIRISVITEGDEEESRATYLRNLVEKA